MQGERHCFQHRNKKCRKQKLNNATLRVLVEHSTTAEKALVILVMSLHLGPWTVRRVMGNDWHNQAIVTCTSHSLWNIFHLYVSGFKFHIFGHYSYIMYSVTVRRFNSGESRITRCRVWRNCLSVQYQVTSTQHACFEYATRLTMKASVGLSFQRETT